MKAVRERSSQNTSYNHFIEVLKSCQALFKLFYNSLFALVLYIVCKELNLYGVFGVLRVKIELPRSWHSMCEVHHKSKDVVAL